MTTQLSKLRVACATLLLLALGGIAYLLLSPVATVRVSATTVQDAVDKRLPLTGRKLGIVYEVSAGKVALRPDGRVGIDAEVRASALRRSVDVHLVGSGIVAYRDGAFFVREFAVEDAKVVRSETHPDDKRLLARMLERVGVENGDAFLAEHKDAIAARVRDYVSGVLRTSLEARPVYTLRQDTIKQSLAKLALRDVKVEDGGLVVTLDIMGLAVRLLLWASLVVLAVACAVGLAFAPGGLLALGVVGLAS